MTEERIETETHHNQRMTRGAAARQGDGPAKGQVKKTVVLRLNPDEVAAFERLGGIEGLKKLLAES